MVPIARPHNDLSTATKPVMLVYTPLSRRIAQSQTPNRSQHFSEIAINQIVLH